MVSEKESQRDLRFGDLFGDLGLWRFVDRVGAMCVKIVIELQINLWIECIKRWSFVKKNRVRGVRDPKNRVWGVQNPKKGGQAKKW
jgi:hypothetical protein